MGLASVLISLAVLILCPLAVIMSLLTWAYADRSSGNVFVITWLARIGVAVPVLVVAIGFWLAMVGRRQAVRDQSCTAVFTAGAWLNAAALVCWVVAAVAVLITTEGLRRG